MGGEWELVGRRKIINIDFLDLQNLVISKKS